MLSLRLDTETSGFPVYKDPTGGDRGMSDHPGQPHMLSLAALLVEDGKIIKTFNKLQKPKGWVIDERVIGDDGKPTAFAINKLSNERLNDEGVPLEELMDEFEAEFMGVCDEHIAWNATFDRKILRIASMRRWGRTGHPRQGQPPKPWRCSMKTLAGALEMSRPYMKLIAGYQWAFNKDFEGQHGAMADCTALHEVTEHMIKTLPNLEWVTLADRDTGV